MSQKTLDARLAMGDVDDLVSVYQVANRLNVASCTVRRHAKAGRIPYIVTTRGGRDDVMLLEFEDAKAFFEGEEYAAIRARNGGGMHGLEPHDRAYRVCKRAILKTRDDLTADEKYELIGLITGN